MDSHPYHLRRSEKEITDVLVYRVRAEAFTGKKNA
jgi:hypothetical protein